MNSPIKIGHLGPQGTYAEAAAMSYAESLTNQGKSTELIPFPNITATIQAVATHQVQFAVVPVENSIEGSVVMTLDTLWQLDSIYIQKALILPIAHALLSVAQDLTAIDTVCSHPQALAQCQGWLQKKPSSSKINTH